MSQITQRIDNLGRREATTVPTTTTQRVFATSGSPVSNDRQAVNLVNLDASAELYVALTRTGAAVPTVSASDCDLVVPAKTDRQLQIGPNLEVYVRSNSASPVAYTALELL